MQYVVTFTTQSGKSKKYWCQDVVEASELCKELSGFAIKGDVVKVFQEGKKLCAVTKY